MLSTPRARIVSCEIAAEYGAEVVQFDYEGGYPKKRQWALDNLPVDTPWVLLLDADEVAPSELIDEIGTVTRNNDPHDAYLIVKGFHFMGRRFRYGGFSHAAVLLLKQEKHNLNMSLMNPLMHRIWKFTSV